MTYNSTQEKNLYLSLYLNTITFRLTISFLFTVLIAFCTNFSAYGQTALFDIELESNCSPATVTFRNNSTGADTYKWIYGDGNTSTNTNTTHTHLYNWGNDYSVGLITYNIMNPSLNDTIYKTLNIIQTVPASFTEPIPSEVCANEWIDFKWHQVYKNSLEGVKWDFGDGRTSTDMNTNPMTHRYSANGTFNVTYITLNNGCNDTITETITVSGPIVEYTVTPDSACLDEAITYTVTNVTDLNRYRWHTGEGGIMSDWITVTNDPYQYGYSTTGSKDISLEVEGTSKNCSLNDNVYVFPIVAGIKSDAPCAGVDVFYGDASIGSNLTHFWDFGDGSTSTDDNLFHTFPSEGQYIITHSIENHKGCADTVIDTIFAHTPPTLVLEDTIWAICRGDSAQLEASGGDSIFWSPDFGLDNPNSYTPKASPRFTNPYNVSVKDTATLCTSSRIVTVFVQEIFNRKELTINYKDTTIIVDETTIDMDPISIIIGDTIRISIDTGDFNYNWSPDYQILSCANCANTVVLPLEETTYILEVSDTLSCHSHTYEIPIKVTEKYIIGVPDAFTPNGDGINDNIKVQGWGIKRIVEFRVYNRWGKEVFFTDNAGEGWDGYIDGKPGAIDSYAYVVKAEMWSGETIVENGTFSLIK